jgi:hypothetical protein
LVLLAVVVVHLYLLLFLREFNHHILLLLIIEEEEIGIEMREREEVLVAAAEREIDFEGLVWEDNHKKMRLLVVEM